MNQQKNETVNPFNFHCTKEKFSVLGKSNQRKGRPGQSRQRGIELREKTIGKEFKERHRAKHGYFKDRRLGENNPSLDAEKKQMLRYVALQKRETKRKMFNLNDEEVLTHKGVALNNDNMQDTADFSDEEESNDEDGKIDDDTVNEQHFGGGLFSRKSETGGKPKTKQDWIDEIIVESKKKKLAAKEEKAMQEEAVSEINEAFPSFLKKKFSQMMTQDDKDEKKPVCSFSSYDTVYQKLKQDEATRANPSDRLKTKEELATEHEEKMKIYEADRKKRMRNAYELQEEESLSRNPGKSADALESFFNIHPIGEESLEEIEEESSKGDIHKDDETEIKEKKDTEMKKKTKIRGEKKVKKKLTSLEVPETFQEFWENLEGINPAELSRIIAKTIEENHPTTVGTTEERYEKCCHIFELLIKLLVKLCHPDGESLLEEVPAISYCESIMAGLFQLVHLSPATSTIPIKHVLQKKFSQFSKTGCQEYPFTDTFIILRIAVILFPASDYEHDVLTPARTFLANILTWSKVNNKRDVLAMFFTANLLFEYSKPNKSFVCELIWPLKALLYLSLPQSEEKSNLFVYKCISKSGPASELLTLSKAKKKFDSTSRIKFSLINCKDDTFRDKLKLVVISETLKLLIKVVQKYARLKIAQCIFNKLKEFVNLMPIQQYPLYVQELQKMAVSALEKISPPGLQLALNRALPTAITFYEPKIEAVRDSRWKKDNPQFEQQRLKLLHKRERRATKREIKKDFQFIANERLKETVAHDTERKRKLNTIIRELGSQECEFQKYKKMAK